MPENPGISWADDFSSGQLLPDWHPLVQAMRQRLTRPICGAIREKMAVSDDWKDHLVNSPFGLYGKKIKKKEKSP